MQDLNQNELETMRVLWEHGRMKPAEIQEDFSWPIENATLRSVLAGLMEKGHVTRRKNGKAYYYRAASNRGKGLSRMANRMAQVFAGGSTAELIAQLIRIEKLSPEDIEELRRIAAGPSAEPSADGAAD
jgi:predicted transcriptional regulator